MGDVKRWACSRAVLHARPGTVETMIRARTTMCTIILEQADRGAVAVYGRPHVNRTRSAEGSESEKSSRSEDDMCGSFALSNEAMAGR